MSTAERSTPPPGSPLPRPAEDDGDPEGSTRVPDHLVEAFMVTDPHLVRRLKGRRERSPAAFRDEVWEGVYVMSPDANSEHQRIVGRLTAAFISVVDDRDGGEVYPGLSVSDRDDGWMANYRIPDIAIYLPENPAAIRKAHAVGGPDFAVEILSASDQARLKLDFYAGVGTRELLLIDRKRWALELYRFLEGKLVLVGISTTDEPGLLASSVLPVTFRLIVGQGRPTIEVARLDSAQVWRI